MLNRDPHVQAAVMFGRGRFNAGVLIDPKPTFKFDPTDTEKLAEFRNAIWYVVTVMCHIHRASLEKLLDRPTVEKLNAFAPQHSRIFKEVVSFCTIV